jgi:hypothetical protein
MRTVREFREYAVHGNALQTTVESMIMIIDHHD